MSETHFVAKQPPQLLLKQGIPVSCPKPTFKPIFGSLSDEIFPGAFYIFVTLSRMVLYQLESLNLVDYNLIYSQNKNRGFDKFLTAFPLKTKHFPFYKHSSKPIPKPIYNQYKTHLSTFGVFPNPNTREKGLGFSFLPLNLLILQHQAFVLLLYHLETINGKIFHQNLALLPTPALFSLPFLFKNEMHKCALS